MNVMLRYAALAAAVLLIAGERVPPLLAQGADGSFQETLNVSGPVDLEVSTGSGAITVRAGTLGRVEVRGRIRVSRGVFFRIDADRIVRDIQSDPPIVQNGDVIRIGQPDDPGYRRYVSISYDITVPPATQLRSRTGSGAQEIADIDGPIDATTGSGSIRIANVRNNVAANTGSGKITAVDAGGNIRVSTGSGSVRLSQGRPGDVEVSTGSGSIEVTGVRGSLRARTGSGGITVDGEPAGRWDMEASSGSVLVRLPQQAAFDLDARTGSGSVTVDHPITVRGRIRRNEITGVVRGGGTDMDIRTGSGSIRVQ